MAKTGVILEAKMPTYYVPTGSGGITTRADGKCHKLVFKTWGSCRQVLNSLYLTLRGHHFLD